MYWYVLIPKTTMPTERMTFSVPGRVKQRARRMRQVNWSAVVTAAIERKLSELELVDRIAANSKLTQKDVDEIAEAIDAAMARRLGLRS